MAIVIEQHHGYKPFDRSQRCRLQSFTHFDYSNFLQPSQTNLTHNSSFKQQQAFQFVTDTNTNNINNNNFHRSLSTPCFPLPTTQFKDELNDKLRIEIVGGYGAPKVHALVVEISIAMATNVEPIPLANGLGGAYLLCNRNGDNIAIAKPIDEEPLAFNNPKGFGGLMLGQPGIKRSIKVGGTGIRELAAYLLDHAGFAGVPPTALVKIADVGFHSEIDKNCNVSSSTFKIASLQRFVEHDFDAGELGSSGFSVASVHQIGIFDIRVLNLDRHAGNILVKKKDQGKNYTDGVAELVPIDHGLCLPEWLDNPYFEWLHWPQASIPFSESELEYISNLDPFKDAQILRTELPSLKEPSVRVLVLCTIFLKLAVVAGLCLADIGKMMTREFYGGEEKLSILENLCAKAKANVVHIEEYNDNDDNDNEDNDDGQNRLEPEEEEKEEEEEEIFKFDDEDQNEDENNKDLDDLPQLLKSPPPKIPKLSNVRSLPKMHNITLSPCKENTLKKGVKMAIEEKGSYNIDIDIDMNEEDKGGGGGGGGLTRSISYSVQNCNCEIGGVFLGDMSENEWSLFLELFEKLLPEVIEGSKCKMGPRLRLGTSCKF
ncbi:phosphatidylinositol 4-kinase gamma 8 [Euphorbia lathyris]|uniref:phosphatidylinositol 4-kinase gamma 8 n=1 Tax=Euphorbia lathyris TaxID=212925 RepID=UPI003313F6A3